MNASTPDVELPHGVALAWGVAPAPQRGPKRELSVDAIVRTAVAIADDKGLGAVSMSGVAAALGFTTMSLYRYVGSKEDLLLLMQDHAIGAPPHSLLEAPTWRDGLSRWYRASLDLYAAHPWILDIDITGMPNTPNNLHWVDSGLTVLSGTPLTLAERLATVLGLSGSARWESLINRGYLARAAETGVSPSDRDVADAHIMSTLVTADRFPQLHEAIRAGVFTGDDNPFEYALQRFLDGVEQHMQQRSGD